MIVLFSNNAMIKVSVEDGVINKGFSLSLANVSTLELWKAIQKTIINIIDDDQSIDTVRIEAVN